MAGKQRSLPDLVARLRLQTDEAKVALKDVQAQITQVGLKAGGEAAEGMKKLGTEGKLAAAETVSGLARVTELLASVRERAALASEQLGKVAEKGKTIGTGAAKGIAEGGIFGGIAGGIEKSGASAVPIIGGVAIAAAGIAGLLGSMDELVKKTAEYSTEVLRNSELLGVNATTYQVLTKATEIFGMDQTGLTKSLTVFEKQLENGGKGLATYGLTLKDVGITSTDLNQALPQLATFLNSSGDASQKNAVAMALLGKNGQALNEVLSKGPDFIKAYEAELKSYGLLLDDSQLKTGALAESINQRFHLALQGLELQVGTQLEGAFASLWLTITKMVGGSDALFKKISDAIGWVVGAVASLAQGLFGVEINLQDFANAANSPTGALNDLAKAAGVTDGSLGTVAGTASAVKDKMAELAEAIRHDTQALDDQKAALAGTAKAQTDALDDQVTAIRATQTALQQQATDTQNLQQLQDDQHQSYLSNLQDELNMLTSVADQGRKSGESLAAYQRRLREDQLKDAITAEQDKRKVAKDTSTIAIQTAKESSDKQIADLELQKKGIADVLAAATKALDDRKTALSRYLQDQQDANSKADAATLASTHKLINAQSQAYDLGAKVYEGITGKSRNTIEASFNQTFDNIGKTIRNWFQHPESILPDVEDFGYKIGAAIVHGVEKAIAEQGRDIAVGGVKILTGIDFGPVISAGSAAAGGSGAIDLKGPGIAQDIGVGRAINAVSAGLASVQHRATGGQVLAGAAYWVGEQGRELVVPSGNATVIPHAQSEALDGARPGSNINVHYHGPVATEYVADRVVERIHAARRRDMLGNMAMSSA